MVAVGTEAVERCVECVVEYIVFAVAGVDEFVECADEFIVVDAVKIKGIEDLVDFGLHVFVHVSIIYSVVSHRAPPHSSAYAGLSSPYEAIISSVDPRPGSPLSARSVDEAPTRAGSSAFPGKLGGFVAVAAGYFGFCFGVHRFVHVSIILSVVFQFSLRICQRIPRLRIQPDRTNNHCNLRKVLLPSLCPFVLTLTIITSVVFGFRR